jgi:hypothetical protein
LLGNVGMFGAGEVKVKLKVKLNERGGSKTCYAYAMPVLSILC